jgi:hypothetical protein
MPAPSSANYGERTGDKKVLRAGRSTPTDYIKYLAGRRVLMDGHSTVPASSDHRNVRSLPRQMVTHIQHSTINQHMHTIDHRAGSPTPSANHVHEYDTRYGGDPIIRQLVQGYTEMVTDRIEKGWTCHLVTFLFSQLPGTRSAVISQMKDEIQRVYSTLLTRVHRKPKTTSSDELPVLIAAADLPVYKRDRSSSPTVLCNGGLHFHGLLLVPPTSRMDTSLEEHFRSNEGLYMGCRRTICGLHVRQVGDEPERVVAYTFKAVSRQRISYDDGILLLPRDRHELDSAYSDGRPQLIRTQPGHRSRRKSANLFDRGRPPC